MKYLDLSFPTPELNLACDEALLDWCETEGGEEMLRTWESPAPFVVVGYANAVRREVHLAECQRRGIPVLRRCSGGGTVVQGPGCLNYALVLRIDESGPLGNISGTNRWVMDRHRQLFERLLRAAVCVQGHTDLTVGGAKFSGNSQRRKRAFLLFHGSFLLHFSLSLIEELLPLPSQQPGYRSNRSHAEFLKNVGLAPAIVKEALAEVWQADQPLTNWPIELVRSMAEQKYARADWNLRY